MALLIPVFVQPVAGCALAGTDENQTPIRLAQDLTNLPQPGEVLINRQTRRDEFQDMPLELLERWCGAERSKWPSHGVTRKATGKEQPGETLAWTMMNAGARLLFQPEDQDAFDAIVDNLKNWASNNALSQFDDQPSARMYYNLNRTLLPVITAYAMVRDSPRLKASERNQIDQWLAELIWRRGPQRHEKKDNVSYNNNHRYLSASVTAAWGVLIGADPLFEKGLKAYRLALSQMNDDGSLPLEMARGEEALFYQRHAIASLITLAEMAAVQGLDLYAETGPQGQDIHKAIAFLADALHSTKVLNERFRKDGSEKAPAQNYDFLIERGHGRHYMAWIEAYKRRFPEKQSVEKLKTALANFGGLKRPMIDDYSGANMTCFFSRNF